MAFPTTAQFNPVNIQTLGMQNILDTNTVQQHALGTRIKAKDVGSLAYGEAEFIYLKGVASTAAGDLVTWDNAFQTTRSVAATRGPIAVAMSANLAAQYGWYMVQGIAPVNTTVAGTGAANSGIQVTATPGQATVSGTAAVKISGARCLAAQDTPTAGFTAVELHFPCANGDT